MWRWLFPVLLGGCALVCAVAAVFLHGGALAVVLGIGLLLAASAAACRSFAGRRAAALDDLRGQLDETDVPAG